MCEQAFPICRILLCTLPPSPSTCFQVRLIASVPGYHKSPSLARWGHLKVAAALKEETNFHPRFVGAPLVFQVRTDIKGLSCNVISFLFFFVLFFFLLFICFKFIFPVFKNTSKKYNRDTATAVETANDNRDHFLNKLPLVSIGLIYRTYFRGSDLGTRRKFTSALAQFWIHFLFAPTSTHSKSIHLSRSSHPSPSHLPPPVLLSGVSGRQLGLPRARLLLQQWQRP